MTVFNIKGKTDPTWALIIHWSTVYLPSSRHLMQNNGAVALWRESPAAAGRKKTPPVTIYTH